MNWCEERISGCDDPLQYVRDDDERRDGLYTSGTAGTGADA